MGTTRRERDGKPALMRDDPGAKPVWVDLRAVLVHPERQNVAGERSGGLDVPDLVPAGLTRWLRLADGSGWVGVVNMILTHNGESYRAFGQLVPAHALRPRD